MQRKQLQPPPWATQLPKEPHRELVLLQSLLLQEMSRDGGRRKRRLWAWMHLCLMAVQQWARRAQTKAGLERLAHQQPRWVVQELGGRLARGANEHPALDPPQLLAQMLQSLDSLSLGGRRATPASTHYLSQPKLRSHLENLAWRLQWLVAQLLEGLLVHHAT